MSKCPHCNDGVVDLLFTKRDCEHCNGTGELPADFKISENSESVGVMFNTDGTVTRRTSCGDETGPVKKIEKRPEIEPEAEMRTPRPLYSFQEEIIQQALENKIPMYPTDLGKMKTQMPDPLPPSKNPCAEIAIGEPQPCTLPGPDPNAEPVESHLPPGGSFVDPSNRPVRGLADAKDDSGNLIDYKTIRPHGEKIQSEDRVHRVGQGRTYSYSRPHEVPINRLSDEEIKERLELKHQLVESAKRVETLPSDHITALSRLFLRGMTTQEIAEKICKSHSWVIQMLSLRSLCDCAKVMLDNKIITHTTALNMARLRQEEQMTFLNATEGLGEKERIEFLKTIRQFARVNGVSTLSAMQQVANAKNQFYNVHLGETHKPAPRRSAEVKPIKVESGYNVEKNTIDFSIKNADRCRSFDDLMAAVYSAVAEQYRNLRGQGLDDQTARDLVGMPLRGMRKIGEVHDEVMFDYEHQGLTQGVKLTTVKPNSPVMGWTLKPQGIEPIFKKEYTRRNLKLINDGKDILDFEIKDYIDVDQLVVLGVKDVVINTALRVMRERPDYVKVDAMFDNGSLKVVSGLGFIPAAKELGVPTLEVRVLFESEADKDEYLAKRHLYRTSPL